jgi:hypothetical protein
MNYKKLCRALIEELRETRLDLRDERESRQGILQDFRKYENSIAKKKMKNQMLLSNLERDLKHGYLYGALKTKRDLDNENIYL